MEINSLISKEYKTIDSEETLSKALSLLRDDVTEVLAVFKGKEFHGILTERMVVRSRYHPESKIKHILKAPPKVMPGATIYEASRLMFQNELKHLPVFDRGFIGFVRDEDVIQAAIDRWPEFAALPVREIMGENVVSVDENDTMAHVINLFREQGISRTPVTSNGKLTGIVTMHDCIGVIVPRERRTMGDFSQEKIPLLGIPVRNFMSDNVITVTPDAKLGDAVRPIIEAHISGLAVCDNGRIKGMVTKSDLLEAISHLKKEEERFFVQFAGDTDDFSTDAAVSELRSLVDKFENFLERGMLHVYFKRYGQMRNENHIVLCKIRVKSPNRFFIAKGEGWSPDDAFHIALDSIERQLLRAKDMANELWVSERFLNKIGFS